MDSDRAETHLRLLAETGLRHALGPEPVSPWECLPGVRAAATALTMIGALDADVAEAIVTDLAAAIALRRAGRPGLAAGRVPSWAQATAAWSAVPVSAGPPLGPAGAGRQSGQTYAAPLGQALMLRSEYAFGDMWLLSVVRTADRLLVAVTGRTKGLWRGASYLHPFGQLTAVDDRGTPYEVHYSGRSAEDRSSGLLSVLPRPADGTPWLELYDEPNTSRVRVDLTGPPTPARVQVDPGGPGSLAERLLDATAESMLQQRVDLGRGDERPDELVAALAAAGALPVGSAAVGRLARLCQQAGFGSGSRLVAALQAGELPAVALPEPWTSVLAYFRRRQRPPVKHGVAPAGVVLPELDGIRFILAGLRSETDQTLLDVVAMGLPPDYPHEPGGGLPWVHWFPWWIKDSTGQWHLTELDGFASSDPGFACLQLRLVPPLSRPVTRLDVIVPGRAVRIRATVPVEWLAAHD